MHVNMFTLIQVHDQHPNNLEALKFMVQLAGDLEDESKRLTYEAALIRVERVLALQDHVPSLSNKQETGQTQSGGPHMGLGAHHATGTALVQQAQWDEADVSSCPDVEVQSRLESRRVPTGVTEDVLGEDLLPGLNDM